MWTSSNEGALDIEYETTSKRLYIVTGSGSANRGRVYAIETDNRDRLRLMARTESSVLSALYLQKDGFLVGTAPDGELLHFQSKQRKSSTYLSKVEDLARISKLGRIWFDADTPKGTKLALSIRTGNTAKADGTWSSWSEAVTRSVGGKINVPDGRYAQFRAILSGSASKSPRLKAMHASLIRMNVAPSIKEVFLWRRGVYLKPLPKEQTKEKTMTVNRSSLKKLRGWASRKPKGLRVRQGISEGMLTAAWTAHDINGDSLLARVEIKPEDEKVDWAMLSDDVQHHFYSFDSH